LDIANSFAIPFDEDDKDRDVWFLDHEYLETMYNMFRKVNAKERVVGWYHTGPKLHQNDILINDLIRKYCPNSVLVITDKTFEHVPTEIGAEEAEEVGVEHLLRDVKDTTVGTLSQRITGQLMGLKGLNQKLQDMKAYLEKVVAGELPMNHEITYQLQDIFNLLPDVTNPVFVRSLQVNTNDQMLVMYIASVIRSVIALHNLINNKLANKEAEKKEGKKEEVKELKEKKEVPEIKAK